MSIDLETFIQPAQSTTSILHCDCGNMEEILSFSDLIPPKRY